MSIEPHGEYQLIRRLATGGMAQIFLARQVSAGEEKSVVLKRIHPHLAENSQFIQMFLDEARVAARLNHPNIVQIFDLGALGDSYFIAMEFIDGEDIRHISKRAALKKKPLSLGLVARIIIEACRGLNYAHNKTDEQGNALNIVHRDVSPQNILIAFDGRVKIVDFGIAKAAGQATVTKSGVLKGKYPYMSPEQANSQNVDRRSDIFALGVILFELATQRRLFKRASEIETLGAVTECRVPSPSKINPAVPNELQAIMLKALAKKPEDRFQDAGELQAALENWLSQSQLDSSLASLSAFMQDLYADRSAQELADGQLSSSGEGKVTPYLALADSASFVLQRPVAKVTPVDRKRASLFLFGLGAFVVVLAAAVGAWMMRPGPVSAPVAEVTAPVEPKTERASRPEAAQEAQNVAVSVVTELPAPLARQTRRADAKNTATSEVGHVRFIVKPWAIVECGSLNLGQTPFADQPLLPGSYDCTFKNPEYPEQKRTVVVKSKATVKVMVNF